MRRRPRVEHKLEKLSVADTLRAIRYAEIVMLVIDATIGLEKQDLTIAAHVVEEGRGMVLAVNKWDAVSDPNATLRAIRDRLSISLPQVRGIPLITVSAREGRNLDGLMRAALALWETWNRRVSTADMNRWLEGALAQHPPPLVAGRPIRIPLCDPDQDATADLCAVRLEAAGSARQLSALSRELAARQFQARRRADPHGDAQRPQSLVSA